MKGFRSARDVSFSPGQICALVGEAKAGKSNLLAAIRAVLDPAAAPLTATDAAVDGGGPISIRVRLAGGAEVALEGSPGRHAINGPECLPPVLFLPAGARADAVLAAGNPEGADAAPALKIFRGARAPDPPTSTAQALTIIDALESCCSAGLSGLILLIEEPELYLRPQAQRYLYRLLRKFSLAGNQTIYSTHSPAFLNVVRLDELIFVERISRAGTRALQPEPVTPDDDFRVMTEFDAARSELFLARAVVLVEGLTEKLVLPFVFAALGHDVDRDAISIIECGGKPNLPLFARICSATGIPLHDRSRQRSTGERQIRRGRAGAQRAHRRQRAWEDHIVVLDPDFEAVAGTRRATAASPSEPGESSRRARSSEMPEFSSCAQPSSRCRWPVVRRPDDTPGSPRPVRGFQRARSQDVRSAASNMTWSSPSTDTI